MHVKRGSEKGEVHVRCKGKAGGCAIGRRAHVSRDYIAVVSTLCIRLCDVTKPGVSGIGPRARLEEKNVHVVLDMFARSWRPPGESAQFCVSGSMYLICSTGKSPRRSAHVSGIDVRLATSARE